MWALRGHSADYDEWQRRGARGWGWHGVLPYFRKLETDFDFEGSMHGRSGPIPIRRQGKADWSAPARAVYAILTDRGWRHVEDANGDFADGHCTLPVSRYENSRASAGLCYLTREVRARRNLQILTNTAAERLTLNGKSVTGVRVRKPDGSVQEYAGATTIVAAGALRTPVLLLKSGIGPADELR